MKNLLHAFTFLFISASAFAQNPEWLKTMHGSYRSEFYDLATDEQGNVYVVGSSGSNKPTFNNEEPLEENGNMQAVIIKLSTNGDFMWSKNYGGDNPSIIPSNGTDFDRIAEIIYQKKTNSIYLDGAINSISPHVECDNSTNNFNLLQKFDTDGNLVWCKSFDGGISGLMLNPNKNLISFLSTEKGDSLYSSNSPTEYVSEGLYHLEWNDDGSINDTLKKYGYMNGSSLLVDQNINLLTNSSYFTVLSQDFQDTLGEYFLKGIASSQSAPIFGNKFIITENKILVPVYNISTVVLGQDTFDVKDNNATLQSFLCSFDFKGNLLTYTHFKSNEEAIVTIRPSIDKSQFYVSVIYTDDVTFGELTINTRDKKNVAIAVFDEDLKHSNFNDFVLSANNFTSSPFVKETESGLFVYGSYLGYLDYNNQRYNDKGTGQYTAFIAKQAPLIVGINDKAAPENLLSVYPNPNTGSFRVIVPNSASSGVIKVYSTTGQIIHRQKFNNEAEVNIILTQKSKGLYHVLLQSGNKNYAAKVLVE